MHEERTPESTLALSIFPRTMIRRQHTSVISNLDLATLFLLAVSEDTEANSSKRSQGDCRDDRRRKDGDEQQSECCKEHHRQRSRRP